MTTTKHRIKSTFLFCLFALNSIASALAIQSQHSSFYA